MQETQVQSLGPEDPPEKEMAIHSSSLAWRIPSKNGQRSLAATVHEVTKNWTQLSNQTTAILRKHEEGSKLFLSKLSTEVANAM